jgi:WD40 repeat protein
VIDRYTLVETLGEGGFGVVWRASQTEPVRREVALKAIKPGMDSRAVLARFAAERQALAVMDHPGIAKVFDAGTTPQGRPYFVMEFVRGEPITDFCDRNRLTIEERLELMIAVCEAVQHAHAKGVVHRDLKPSNVLVGYDGEGRARAKVIDFGVAKALNTRLAEATLFTERGQLIGTPEYMSPEQAEMSGLDIDTRSDVYSLGVILYELLTGVLPFDPATLRAAGFAEIQRIIREVEPARPSTRLETILSARDPATASRITGARRTDRRHLRSELKRDLDWIVVRTLEKNRERRYDSPALLAAELRRYLDGEPVLAGPPGAGYRIGKFVRRRRGPVAAAAIILLLIVTGSVVSLIFAIKAHRASVAEALQAAAAERSAAEAAVEALRARTAEALASRRAEEAEWAAYAANLGATDASLAAGRSFGEVQRRLDACPEHLRGWEWRWLGARCDSSLMALPHTDDVKTAAYTPDGRRILTASGTRAHLWDAATGTELLRFEGHARFLTGAWLSPDGSRVVTAADDSTARVWETATGRALAVLRHEGAVTQAAFNPDATRVVTGSRDQTARLWDAQSGEEIALLGTFDDAVMSVAWNAAGDRVGLFGRDGTARLLDAATLVEVARMARQARIDFGTFSAEGALLATASSNQVSLWDGRTGAFRTFLDAGSHGDGVSQFGPGGSRIVTVSGLGKRGRLWDTASGEMLLDVGWSDYGLTAAAISPDGGRIALGAFDGSLGLVDPEAGGLRAIMRGHSTAVSCLAYSPDGLHLLSGSGDRTARIWDAHATPQQVLHGHTDRTGHLALSPDGARLASAGNDGPVRLWDAVTGAALAVLRSDPGANGVRSIAFSPDGARLAVAHKVRLVVVWDVVTGRRVSLCEGHVADLWTVSFALDGARLLSTDGGGSARLWETATGRELGTYAIAGVDRVVAGVSPDGRRAFAAHGDGTCRLIDTATGTSEVLAHRESAGPTGVYWSADGKQIRLLVGGRPLRVLDADTLAVIMELSGHSATVTSASTSPDGTLIVTSSDDGTARLWDAASGQTRAVLRHSRQVHGAAFHPSGTRVVTAGHDHTARVWDVATGEEVAVLAGHTGPVLRAIFDRSGERIVSSGWDGTIRFWDSVPYRDRYPATREWRQRAERMQRDLAARLAGGESFDAILDELAALGPERDLDRRVGLSAITALRAEE